MGGLARLVGYASCLSEAGGLGASVGGLGAGAGSLGGGARGHGGGASCGGLGELISDNVYLPVKISKLFLEDDYYKSKQ